MSLFWAFLPGRGLRLSTKSSKARVFEIAIAAMVELLKKEEWVR